MAYNIKYLILLFFPLFFLSNAYSLDFLNVSYHQAHDSNDHIYVEQAMLTPNGTYDLTDSYRSVVGIRHDNDMGNFRFVTEIWANTSTTSWTGDAYGNAVEKINITFRNVDNDKVVYKTYNIYKNSYPAICYLSWTGVTPECISIMNDGIDEGSGVYSYKLIYTANDVQNALGLGTGWFGQQWLFPSLPYALYGWTQQDSYFVNATHIMSIPQRSNNLFHINTIGEPNILQASINDIISQEYPLDYSVTWQGYYSPYDLAYGILDNTTFVNNVLNVGYVLGFNTSYFIAYKQSNDATFKQTRSLYNVSSVLSISEIKLLDKIDLQNYVGNKSLVPGNIYYLMIFHQRSIGNQQYLALIGYKEFMYVPLGDGSGVGCGILKYKQDLTVNTGGHALMNTTLADYWFMTSFSVSDKLSHGKIHANMNDIFPYYTDTFSGVNMPINYSVQKDNTGNYRLLLMLDEIDRMSGSVITVCYGSNTNLETNNLFQNVARAGVEFKTDTNNTFLDVINFIPNDIFIFQLPQGDI
jgi:hypothetical protein